jgi:hypothetical protein
MLHFVPPFCIRVNTILHIRVFLAWKYPVFVWLWKARTKCWRRTHRRLVSDRISHNAVPPGCLLLSRCRCRKPTLMADSQLASRPNSHTKACRVVMGIMRRVVPLRASFINSVASWRVAINVLRGPREWSPGLWTPHCTGRISSSVMTNACLLHVSTYNIPGLYNPSVYP